MIDNKQSDFDRDKTGIFDYAARAREILRHCVHQAELVPGGRAMWDDTNHLIRFVPEADFSDPSYHLPHFYEVFAERADPEDRLFWKEAAEASRKYLALSAHPDAFAHSGVPAGLSCLSEAKMIPWGRHGFRHSGAADVRCAR